MPEDLLILCLPLPHVSVSSNVYVCISMYIVSVKCQCMLCYYIVCVSAMCHIPATGLPWCSDTHLVGTKPYRSISARYRNIWIRQISHFSPPFRSNSLLPGNMKMLKINLSNFSNKFGEFWLRAVSKFALVEAFLFNLDVYSQTSKFKYLRFHVKRLGVCFR